MTHHDYDSSLGIDAYVELIDQALPMTLHELQRKGVSFALLKDLAARLGVTKEQLLTWLGGEPQEDTQKNGLTWRSGIAALGLLTLIAEAQRLVAQLPGATPDAIEWFGGWLQCRQLALGGHRPCDLLDTPQGVEMVKRVLGAITSDVYL